MRITVAYPRGRIIDVLEKIQATREKFLAG